MTREQYRRANLIVKKALSVILLYMIVTLGLAFLINGDRTLGVTIQMATAIVAMVVVQAIYVKEKETKKCGIVMMIAGATVYAIVVLFNKTDGTYAYVYPILCASIIYLNPKLVKGGSIVALGANIIKMIMEITMDGALNESRLLAVLVLALTLFVSVSVSKMLMTFNIENMDVINAQMQKNTENNQKMQKTAEQILLHFEQAKGMLDELNGSIETSNFSMTNITESTESTAEAIQKQANMCSSIQQVTEKAEEGTTSMIASSRKAENLIVEGSDAVKQLKAQAEIVEEASNNTAQTIERLTQKVDNVQNFVNTIVSISNQTNLLALNASIEAARAGEAGKGFAVVADEIRQLSEQTKSASNNITDIIHELSLDTKNANESIDKSVDSVSKQNELIEDTRQKFEAVDEETKTLMDNINNVENIIQEIIRSTEIILENITQLSATSEEVAASSAAGLKTSEDAVKNMHECNKTLENIRLLAQTLHTEE